MTIEQLHKIYLQCTSVSTDTRNNKEGVMFFALKGDNFNGNKYAKEALNSGAKYAIIDEEAFNTHPNCILVNHVLSTFQQLASYHRAYLKTPIIALTGSNGKTTTKELIRAVLSEKYKTTATIGNLNNHIGVPLTLLAMDQDTEIGIVEMGANHQKEIAFLCDIAKPDYGYITNFGKAHLEGFGGVEEVIKGKSEMYDYLMANNKTIFVNANDPIQVEKTKDAKRFSFGYHIEGTDVSIDFVEAQPFVKCSYNTLEIHSQLIGDYNFNNIAAAIAIGNYFKVKDSAIKSAIECYVPSNNRSQIINKGTNKIILDAYNANPTSMRAALLNLEKQSGHKIAILGDMFELGKESKQEHNDIADLALRLQIDQLIFIGENFYGTEVDSDKVKKTKTFTDFKNNFDTSVIGNATVLIKGSRGMALERILELL
ncbi:UDP-N-acetylmuramoyl-tripeptide--D-alanyl-D-alanine ligase [Changchengzhania lutea]|uniref:UDP-N-acetylmuramoyl-tripeptide--D-alanyl-D- alanine ligase n=1 Tax=Changchengzhania lutea TaxID=2049305 RepID=UPI00115F0D1F|nr:UDP-N-acetylmuramoyl-tripeptide--D-alanyl-D-alanine ligase [Changchengzhania lutea]